MANLASARQNSGRTPPIVLAGLLVLVCVLAYNYWSLSNTNSVLNERINTLVKNGLDERAKRDSQLDSVKQEVVSEKKRTSTLTSTIQEKEEALVNLKKILSEKQSDLEKCNDVLKNQEQNQQRSAQELNALRGEKEAIEKAFAEEKAKVCDSSRCSDVLKSLVTAGGTLMTADEMSRLLAAASLNANDLMQGVEFQPPKVDKPNIPVPQQNDQIKVVEESKLKADDRTEKKDGLVSQQLIEEKTASKVEKEQTSEPKMDSININKSDANGTTMKTLVNDTKEEIEEENTTVAK